MYFAAFVFDQDGNKVEAAIRGEADRTVLVEEAQRRRVSFKATRGAEQINLGALCNVPRHFHFHVVARFADDPNGPGLPPERASPLYRLQVFRFWAF